MKLFVTLLIFIFLFSFFFSCTRKNNESNFNLDFKEIHTNSDTIVNWNFSNNKLKRSSRYVKGKLFGTTNIYYEHGNVKATYFFNRKSELLFQAEFLKDGHILKFEGEPTIFFTFPNRDSVQINKPFNLGVMTPKIPKINTVLTYMKNEKGKLENVREIIVGQNVPLFSDTFDSIGMKHITVVASFYREIELIYRDTTTIEINVISL